MELLNQVSESVLQYVINNADNKLINSSDVYTNFAHKYPKSKMYAALLELNEKNYVRFIVGETSINGKIVLLPAGLLYYEKKHTFRIEYLKQLSLSKTSDVIVAIVTSALFNINWKYIVSFINKLINK